MDADPARRAPDDLRALPPWRRQRAGLGLYIVREIARAHGGNATVSSSEAAGTPFRLSLPKSATAQHDCLVVDAYEKGSPHSQQPGEYLWARAVQLVTLRRAARVRDGPFTRRRTC